MIPRRSDRLAAGRCVLKRSDDVASAALTVPSDIHKRDAAFAPLRIDCGLRPCRAEWRRLMRWGADAGPSNCSPSIRPQTTQRNLHASPLTLPLRFPPTWRLPAK